MLSVSSPAVIKSTVPGKPAVPQEILELATKPLFTGRYTATETETWRDGLPLFGTKLKSTREIGFSNEFNILKTGAPMIGYAASSYDDAVRAAVDLAYDWSDPAIGGQIYSSVGVAILQATNGAYYMALVGSGNPHTSSSELGYRSDKFDDNIHGILKRSEDSKATTPWSKPVDKDGKPVDVPAPADDSKIVSRHVEDIKLQEFVSATSMLKGIVDVREHHKIG